jgi:hypothetical protein
VPDIDEILAVVADPGHKREATARILLHNHLLVEHRDAETKLVAALEEHDDEVVKPDFVFELAAKVKALEEQIDAQRVPFRFVALPHRDWLKLIAKHPPTREQAAKKLDHDEDSLPPAAIAATCVDPVMSVDQAAQLCEALPLDQYQLLWGTCTQVNRGGGVDPKSELAGLILRSSGRSVTTAANGVSHGPSSSANES